MMQGRVAWMVLACVLGALGLAVLGICVGSVGFENVLRPLLSPELDPQGTALARQIVWDRRDMQSLACHLQDVLFHRSWHCQPGHFNLWRASLPMSDGE